MVVVISVLHATTTTAAADDDDAISTKDIFQESLYCPYHPIIKNWSKVLGMCCKYLLDYNDKYKFWLKTFLILFFGLAMM